MSATIIRVEETAGTEVRRLLSQRDGCRDDEQIRFAVFGNICNGYLRPDGEFYGMSSPTIAQLPDALLYSDVNECMAEVRRFPKREGRRIAVSTPAPTITETIVE
jgi:hypothetical protein